MRRFALYSFIIFLLLSANAGASSPTSAAGAELVYIWLHDSTYTVYYHFYRDCSGAAEPDTIPLCYSNSCGLSSGMTYLTKLITFPGGAQALITCHPSICVLPTSTIQDYREWWYGANVTLPKCTSWKLSTAISYRPSNVNNLLYPSSSALYVEATLDNYDALNVSSPYFGVKASVDIFDSVSYGYDPAIYDVNGDSLSIQCINPLTGTNCNPVPEAYASGYSLPSNPLACGNSFVFDSTNGKMFFTPVANGSYVLTILANAYRKIGTNIVKISSAMRDQKINVMTGHTPAPTISLISSSITGASSSSGTINACAGTRFSFSYDCKTIAHGDKLGFTDNYAAFGSPPHPTVTGIDASTDSIRVTFSWVPGMLDTGLKVYTVTTTDSTCADGIFVNATYNIPVYIHPSTKIINANPTICQGASTQLYAIGGSGFSWGVLPGGSPITSLSCTGCSNPIASPTVATYYTLSATNPLCYNRDTALIKLDTIPAKPTIFNSGRLCQWDTMQLLCTAPANTSYAWSGPVGFTSGLASPIIYPPVAGVYKLHVYDAYGCNSPDDTLTKVIWASPNRPYLTPYTPVCANQTLGLTAINYDTIAGIVHADTVNSFNWTGPGGFSFFETMTSYGRMYRYPAVSGVYKVYSVGLNDCRSLVDTINVTVLPIPSKPKASGNYPVCTGDSLKLYVTDSSSGISYAWSGPAGFSSTVQNPIIAPVSVANAGYYTVKALFPTGCYSYDTTNAIVNAPSLVISQPQNVTTCNTSNALIRLSTTGSSLSYQWQVNTGNGFSPLTEGSTYMGTSTSSLNIHGVLMSMNGCQYRCMITGICQPSIIYSDTVVLTVTNTSTWYGSVDDKWSNPANWSCGIIPTGSTEVYIAKSSKNMPLIDIPGAICDSLFIEDGASLAFNGANNSLEIKGSVLDHAHGFSGEAGGVIFSGVAMQLVPASTYNQFWINSATNKLLQGNIKILNKLQFGSGMVVLNGNI